MGGFSSSFEVNQISLILGGFPKQVGMGGVSQPPSSPAKNLCYNALKTLFLAVVFAPVPFFILISYSLYTSVMPILILINVRYLQDALFAL